MKLLSNFLVPIFTSFVYMLYLSDLVYLCIQNFLAHQSVSAIFFFGVKASLANSTHKYSQPVQ